MIHRFLELPAVLNSLEILLDHLGGLYKFHGQKLIKNSIVRSSMDLLNCFHIFSLYFRSPSNISVQHITLLREKTQGSPTAKEEDGYIHHRYSTNLDAGPQPEISTSSFISPKFEGGLMILAFKRFI